MATLQLHGWWKPSPTNSTGGSEALLSLRATRLRSCPASTRRSDLILKRTVGPIGSTRPLTWVPLKNRVTASLTTDAVVATCAEVVRGVVVPVTSAGPLLVSRVGSIVQELPVVVQLSAASVGLLVFGLWGLDSPVRFIWGSAAKADSTWEKCQTRTVLKSYVRPVVLWAGIIMMCRALDSVELPSEASTAIRLRLTHFVRSLTTVSVFALCTGSLIQQVQKYLMKRSSLKDSRSVSLPFIGNAVSTSVWVAAVCLFLELLGFSTHRWLAAGGFGTVLLTLAGREIFTNFLSSVMIHATKPFVESEWIQTKIEGQEVQGHVEHVGWWSPTVIRGDDREAVLIPNHKFSVSVVRNLTQKTHWRIKTHIAISHHDVKKSVLAIGGGETSMLLDIWNVQRVLWLCSHVAVVTRLQVLQVFIDHSGVICVQKIVAGMRKVIAYHPEIEQRRLHRRVFFDYVNSENLALMIMISCFVKTSRFEKYLRVKEGLLLDLLKVVAHHGGRLATPVRSMQRHVEESETRPVSYKGSQPGALLLTAVSSKSGGGDQKSSSSNEQKVYQRNQAFKESSQSTPSVETVVVSVSSDTIDQGDSLSNLKAMKKMEASASRTNDSVPAGEKPLVEASDDVKEPDNRRLESTSQRGV